MSLLLPTPPTAPSLTDPTNFDTRTDAFLAWMAELTNTWNGAEPLVAGDFGIGGTGSLIPNDNLNDIVASGVYSVGVSTLNQPTTGASGSMLIAKVFDTVNNQIQTYHRREGTRVVVYHRQKLSGTWQGWQQQYGQGNILDTVAQSGGIPTGGVIQRGSTASGDFVRYADGTQICWSNTVSQSSATTSSGSVFVGGQIAWTYPAVFIGSSPVVATCSPQNDFRWASVFSVGVSSAGFRHISTASSATQITTSMLAIGRWY